MKIIEIENKHFYAHSGGSLVLESYTNPEAELSISFNQVAGEYDKKFYNAIVTEKQSGKKVVLITFSLSSKNSNLEIGTIEPFDEVPISNTVHTSLGSYQGGVDMGYTALKWVQRQIRDFAKNQGFNIKRITSVTRSTGARAKNNPGSSELGLPKEFNVTKTLREGLIYNCITDTFEIKRFT